MNYSVKEEGKFKYLESRPDGEVIMLLHGLFGALSNFSGIIESFGPEYRVVVPILPIYDLPIHQVSLDGLVSLASVVLADTVVTLVSAVSVALVATLAFLDRAVYQAHSIHTKQTL